jgi:hypothetical protein
MALQKINSDLLAANAVTAAKLAAGTITADDLAANSISSAKIAANAVSASELASGALASQTLTGSVQFSGAVTLNEDTLTDGATISWDVTTSPIAKVTLAGNRTLSAPSNAVGAGQYISLLVIQDGTGSRTLTWNAVYEFTADTAPTLTTTANYGDLFTFRYNGTKWIETGRNLNLVLS